MTGEQGPIRYGGWSRDRHGWIFGLGAAAWVMILLAGLPLLLAAGTHRWPLAAAWLPIWAVLIVLVTVPVRGRPAARWATDCLLRGIGAVTGWSAWQAHAATGQVDDLAEADLPGVLSGIRVHDGPPFGPHLIRPAIIADQRAQQWSAIARITHPGIGLADEQTRARLGAGLAELLEATTSSELVSLVALQVRTIPDDGAERNAWQRTHLRTDAPPIALAVTAELSTALTQAGVRHEALLTICVPERRIARHAREAGGGVDGRARVLYSVMAQIEAQLLGPVGCTGVSWLDSPALAAAIRTGFAPGERARLTATTLATGTSARGGLPMAAAGPSVAPAPEQRHYHHDAWQTVSCTVLLPDKGAIMGALAPVITPTVAGERRCLTLFLEPIAHHRADRMVGTEAMSADLAAEVRRKSGFAIRATQRRDAARVQGQDVRLADGRALVRAAMAAAVTVPDSWPIADYGRRLEAAITTSGFTPLRLDLAQDTGFAAACIPLGVGLPRRRGSR